MKKKYTEQQSNLLKVFIKLVEEKKMWPSTTDLAVAGFNHDRIHRAFGSRSELRKAAQLEYPKICEAVVDTSVFSKKRFNEIKGDTRNYKRFIITTVIEGCKVDEDFLASIDAYCKKNDALLLLLSCADPARQKKDDDWHFDPVLKERYFIGHDMALNQALWLSTVKLSAKHIDPITSLTRLGQRNGSFIYASPKQRLKMVATASKKPPVAVMTTGALTFPDYSTSRYMSDRTAKLADNDHIMGALIVEISGPRHFHFRQIQADDQGSFIDFGKLYEGDDISAISPAACVLGDYHSGETDPVVDKCWREDLAKLKPQKIIFHDLFNGLSINHHDSRKKITLARRSKKDKLNLRREVAGVALDLNKYLPLSNELVVVKSNHDEFLDNWLDYFEFRNDTLNLEYGLELALHMTTEEKKTGLAQDPLKYAVEQAGLKNTKNVRWLKRQEGFKIAGIECGDHGDKGPNGAHGSLRAMEEAYGRSGAGHAHRDEIFRQCYQVGTSSILDPEYAADGISSWTQSRCDIYPNGMRQLIRVVDGKTHLED
jgi:hypothetical protein